MKPPLTLIRRLAAALALAALVASPLWAQPKQAPAETPRHAKYAGTYRIDNWKSLEPRGLYHFFYLHPSKRFLLAAEWEGNESSRIAGFWRVAGGQLVLTGTAHVKTNKGRWRVPFNRTFRIIIDQERFRLRPKPEKNRYGLLGWPNDFVYHRAALRSNLPAKALPTSESGLLALIRALHPDS